jgi:SOUL heme-binding protein
LIITGRTGISAEKGLSPDFRLLASRGGFDVRAYPSYLVAEVTHASEKSGADADKDIRSNSFKILAKYIGVFGTPENEAQTALSMTSPVVMQQSESVSMTSPVVSSGASGENAGTMSFIMPSKYKTLSDLPKPKDSRIKLKEIPAMVSAIDTCMQSILLKLCIYPRFALAMQSFILHSSVSVQRACIESVLTHAMSLILSFLLTHAQTTLCMTFYGNVNDGGVAKLKEFVKLITNDSLFCKYVKQEPTANKWRLASYTPPFTLPQFAKKDVWILLEDLPVDEAEKLIQSEKTAVTCTATIDSKDKPDTA